MEERREMNWEMHNLASGSVRRSAPKVLDSSTSDSPDWRVSLGGWFLQDIISLRYDSTGVYLF